LYETEKDKEIKNQNQKFSIFDEKTGIKYDYNPEGIHIGKETVERVIYLVIIILSIIFSIILTIYLNKKFSQ